MATEAQKNAAWAVIAAILEAIEGFGPTGVPSGHLYANVMGKLSLESYQNIIKILVLCGKVTDNNHLLIATKFTK